ncbi:hypothetical protein MASR2M29_03590 [Spirochaetota bacterium]
MNGLNENEIYLLISCKKKTNEAPKKNMQLKNRSYRNDMKIESIDNKHKFSVFMRCSEDFPEDFSIGLIYLAETGKNYMIYRCNGPHGESLPEFQNDEPHFGYHEHIIMPGTNTMKSLITNKFGTYQDALRFFCSKCNIIDASDYFSFINSDNQLNLDFE